MKELKFSLIMPTLNRRDEVKNFLKALNNQTYTNFELIIIDQNRDDLIVDIVDVFTNNFVIVYVRSDIKGLSYNRNLGLKYAKGDLICFPDDDCEYPIDLLSKVLKEFNSNPDIGIITGSTKDKVSGKSYLNSPSKPKKVNYLNIFSTAISFTIFVNTRKCPVYKFDKKLGVGSKFGSSEETDFLIQYLNSGFNIYFNPEIIVYHPVNNSSESLSRSFNYALGFGAIHRKYFSTFYFIYFFRFCIHLIVNFIRILFFVYPQRNFYILRGKILGFIKY